MFQFNFHFRTKKGVFGGENFLEASQKLKKMFVEIWGPYLMREVRITKAPLFWIGVFFRLNLI